jgi:hypothetical protein
MYCFLGLATDAKVEDFFFFLCFPPFFLELFVSEELEEYH